MTKDQDFKLLKIQTCVLKVNIHCDGCKHKVKKLLQRIEGVYQVNIDADQQKVTVSGSVDSATLIKKLGKAGKHAEIWSQKPNNQDQKQKNNNFVKDESNNKSQNIKGLEALKKQQKFPAFSSEEEEDDDYFDDEEDDDEEEDEEDELRFLRPTQLGLLRQQMDANNAKKGIDGVITAAAAAAAANNNKMNNILNGNVEKKGNSNPNQNVCLKMNPEKAMAMAGLKMNNAQLGGGNITSPEEGRMMNLAGFHGNSAAGAGGALGGGVGGNNHNGYQQVQSNNGSFPTSSMMMMNMNGSQHHPAVMMNMQQNRNEMMQNQGQAQLQPQMMYNRAALIPPNTAYYYNYSPAPYPPPYTYTDQLPNLNGDNYVAATTHVLSDENTSICAIM
ncbi:heavy metal-associated isoprenylated plant protein 37 [Euphorbia lathyris]|uniref:heavy metal-associated isoprenylated plant protein 37 n=1 Tax=Euphorbia lathyris TaxID=212925 RepID=UPI003313E0FF